MDLIYALPDKTDLGVLKNYEFDLAYGKDENNFVLTMILEDHCCENDYFVYMIDSQNDYEAPTEYGGIIDAVTVNTEERTVTYQGRTWHGILSQKVIEPEDGADYRTVSGNANDVLSELITLFDLDSLFTADSNDSEIEINSYKFPRYVDGYSGIADMLAGYGGKLKMVYDGGIKKVILSAEWLTDFSQNEEWDSSQVKFEITKTKNPVNHLVCLGQGDLKNRAVIHLFLNENGGLMPYATVAEPLEDSDYILDKSQQVLTGSHEIAQTYSFPSAGIKENYIKLTTQPDDWNWNYSSYYKRVEDGYEPLEATETTTLTVLTAQPSDWTTKYGNYFTSNGKAVEGTQTSSYELVTKKPDDWKENYKNYFTRSWDGVQYIYSAVTAKTVYEYVQQISEPSNWQTNYNSYYQHKTEMVTVKDKNGKAKKDERGNVLKTKVVGKGYEAVTKIVKGSTEVVPTWKKKKFFTRYSSQVAPSYTSGGDKYRLVKTTTAPTWASGTYYTVTAGIAKPTWKSNVYYKLVYDRYAELVEDAIERLTEIGMDSDSINIDLNLLGEYDVGDIVGASEQTTGIEVWQPITKKIVSITQNRKSITYKIGEVLI